MKKTFKILTVILTIAFVLALLVIPTAAAEMPSEFPVPVFEEQNTLPFGSLAAISSNLLFAFLWCGFCLLIAATVIGFTIFEVIYIFVNAPKCEMTRFWAIVPLVSRLFGLILFIYVFTRKKQGKTAKTTTCPNCQCKLNQNSNVCPICGATI